MDFDAISFGDIGDVDISNTTDDNVRLQLIITNQVLSYLCYFLPLALYWIREISLSDIK